MGIFQVHGWRQAPCPHFDRLNEILRLFRPRPAQAIEMIGADLPAAGLGLAPMVQEARILPVAAFGGLEIYEVDRRGLEGVPVDAAIMVRQVETV